MRTEVLLLIVAAIVAVLNMAFFMLMPIAAYAPWVTTWILVLQFANLLLVVKHQ